ncbi:tripartite tricarboxylate transporter family receptor [Variibacter gotjawalensis]|uniref:Tripartite tricarboxylate transporter family receptor n=1 Tax=Variibacter gotjawalensis TaxID=1333996 RepID=A0A0S3PNF6_9BRAD|nr:tripartite tricarboxylate transporter substrate binding protein [Variibacter gotjawalensis]NIK47790.1 tripartite-type tricarboxylate transporter receptor subunit TctC [Variibacter gotjawalensis]RZS49677.1 tripartite-type tricarboxylate transporter receptor subunit TctC [Variibacter gotjawalensis]BAT57506.1 tripartite tricarboxylate transporter family receptor [Variibacter gotjawalensis]
MKRFVLTALAALALANPASAQSDYPNRPINLILPFAAGSGTDTTTRIISQLVGQELGGSFVIENKAGANGSIAAQFVARAKPDGYTLLVTTNTTHSANPSLLKNMSYDPIKDFVPVARTGDLPFFLLVHPDVKANNVKELIALAKASPGKLTYASGSSSSSVSGATFARRAGIDILHVPYKSSPPALNDLLGGRTTMMFVDVPTGMPHVISKALRPFAMTTRTRSPLMPDLPSMEEAGVPDFDISSWQGWFAPAGTPQPIVEKLNAAIQKVIKDPALKSRLAEMGMDAFSGSQADFDKFVKDQLVLWTRLIKDAGIEPM